MRPLFTSVTGKKALPNHNVNSSHVTIGYLIKKKVHWHKFPNIGDTNVEVEKFLKIISHAKIKMLRIFLLI